MSEIKVTFAALETARADVSGTAASISGRLDDLKRRLAPLAATWEGQAALEYQQRQRQWDASAADLTAVLAQIGVALGQAHDEYLATETLNAGRWRV